MSVIPEKGEFVTISSYDGGHVGTVVAHELGTVIIRIGGNFVQALPSECYWIENGEWVCGE